jgi:hypothetical protein
MAEVSFLFDEGASFIVIDATPQENHTHALTLTDHPVERGADVTDHARVKPDILSLDCCLSDGAEPGRASAIYERLRLLQDNAVLLTVLTSLRQYENMVMESLSVPRTAKDAGGVRFSASFKQVRLVQNRTTVVTVTKEPITKKKVSTGKQAAQNAKDGAQKQATIAKTFSDSTGLSSLLGL